MRTYKSLKLNDGLMRSPTSRRRLYIFLALCLLLTTTLLYRKRTQQPLLLHFHSSNQLGRPGVVYPLEEQWDVPPNWDPVNSYYDDFPRLETAFSGGTNDLRSPNGIPPASTPHPYSPLPDYGSAEYRHTYMGNFVPCKGPRGLSLNESIEDMVIAYDGAPPTFPDAPLGSSSLLGLDQNVCFDRQGRFGSYGLPSDGTRLVSDVKWDLVDWSALQNECVEQNRDRFDMTPRPLPGDPNFQKGTPPPSSGIGVRKKRNAVLFRAYDGMIYSEDVLRTMRAVITELALASGGEYQAFLLVQIKDETLPIFDDPKVYQRVLRTTIPREFWGITFLWNVPLWDKEYPTVPLKDVHASQWLPVQWFARKYPNFDNYWNWEMDIRYTGHHYELLEKLDTWTKAQPRKGMWERNERFYIPSYHGDYDTDFRHFIQSKYETRSSWTSKDSSIWGPHLPADQDTFAWDILPPPDRPTPLQDNFEWGVGEDADLITLLPMFNPNPTHYVVKFGFWNYPPELEPVGPPRRTTIITFFRISNRLLSAMHFENTQPPYHHMSSEQWPQAVAMHHGFKAIYAPHSLWMDRQWPSLATNFLFNNGDMYRSGSSWHTLEAGGEGSGGPESVFGHDREHNFEPSTWYYRTTFATRLYKRLLGYDVDGIGGPKWEETNGNFCLPPMLFHQIKALSDPEVANEHQSADEAAAKNKEAELAAQEKEAAELKAMGAKNHAEGK